MMGVLTSLIEWIIQHWYNNRLYDYASAHPLGAVCELCVHCATQDTRRKFYLPLWTPQQ